MKRFIALVIMALFIASFPVTAFADEDTYQNNVIYFEDGSYIVVTVVEKNTRAAGEREGYKYFNYYDKNGVLGWRLQLMGYYEYDGTTATCVSVASVFLPEDDAYVQVSKTNSKSGNTASCKLVVEKKLLGITTSKTTHTFNLSCVQR